MQYIILFYTHTGALKFQRYAKKNKIHCELMPVPRRLSSSCSISARIVFNDDIKKIYNSDMESIYRVGGDKEVLVLTQN